MAEPRPHFPTEQIFQETDPALIAKELETLIKQFVHHLNTMINNPGLMEDSNYLSRLVSNVKSLDAPSKAAKSLKRQETCLCEDLRDAGMLIQNVLTEKLSIHPRSESPSLISAAVNFTESEASGSDFRMIILNLLHYPQQTEMLLKELNMIALDICE